MSVSIYKISSTAGEKVYIGSTSKTLEERWCQHPKGCTSRVLFDEYGRETLSIHLLEEVKEDERVIRERWWIENTENVVNRMTPGRTSEEYHEEYNEKHRDQINARQRQYHEEHRDQIKAYQREYSSAPTPCPKCGKVLRRSSIREHLKAMHL